MAQLASCSARPADLGQARIAMSGHHSLQCDVDDALQFLKPGNLSLATILRDAFLLVSNDTWFYEGGGTGADGLAVRASVQVADLHEIAWGGGPPTLRLRGETRPSAQRHKRACVCG